ncbi:hypothetical protein [Gandjariella thermophila]|uniref:Uncharacterized protein n=1 Tax=Gandjariella thermophila TaxID=1931992 RepID=A0A4D4JAD1_9PSEU|nr:hypothetical protein [Gandjariella thermophila]GDY32282.1 hypothetical protein GTS_39150 [Gandjariella thermophila]
MLVPLILGFVGSYAAADVIATLLNVANPLLVTLVVGTLFFAVIVLLTRRRRHP